MNKNYVWYACYGSNLLKERFMLYIKECNDKTEPSCEKPIIIHHDLYFANSSSRWENKGVAFIKPEKNEKVATLGRMYIITEEQFLEIQEN